MQNETSKQGHTPGPWTVSRGFEVWPDDRMTMVRKVARVVHNTTDDPHDVNRQVVEMGDREAMANARLIAAAPELLEALEWCIGWIEEYEQYISDGPANDNKAYTQALAAIAKARG